VGQQMAERVYIIDDEAMVRRLLKRAMDHAGMQAQVFETGAEFIKALDKLEPGVILLDIRMPQMDGLQVLEAMGSRTRVFPILILSSHGDVSTAVRAIHAGALDFLEKPFSIAPLVERVRELQGKIELWQNDRRSIAASQSRIANLTEREKEVGKALAAGLANKQIARMMDISPRTVEAHRANLMKKLGVSSVAEVVRLFIE
jgi:two-component system, LuxR family, response regulator FixJ